MLKIAEVSKSSYFYEISTYGREDKGKELKDAIAKIFDENKGRYGYPRITLELRNRGIHVNHKRVQRLMRQMGLMAKRPRSKYNSYKGDFGKKCDNLLLDKDTGVRHFETTGLDQKWTTDVSEFHISSGKLYLSPILDMHNRDIVSYNVSTSPSFAQIEDMLNKAFADGKDLTGLIFHSDQGWQYQMERYHQRLKEKGILQSMSRKGNCLDNSLMENFFGVMKNEMFYGHEYEFESLEQLKDAMVEYIDYYNGEQDYSKIKRIVAYTI